MVNKKVAVAPSASPVDFLTGCFALHYRVVNLVENSSKDLNLTASEAIALHCLSRRPETVSALARQVGLHANGGSVLISRLVSRRLVRRQRSRTDRRATIISLTDTGQSVAATLQMKLWSEAEALLAPLARPAQQDFLYLLQQLSGTED